MARFTWILVLAISFYISGCKSDSSASTSSVGTPTSDTSITEEAVKCYANDVDHALDEKCESRIRAPNITRIHQAPILLDRTPFITWNPGYNEATWENLPAQIQILKESDRSVIYPWTAFTARVVTGLNLVEGESYYISLRTKLANGRTSATVKSASWTATVGKGTWAPISRVSAPIERAGHTALWTGSKMLIWGGQVASGGTTDTGAIYDPVHDTWTAMSTVGAPSRVQAAGVWTGAEMIVWGGPWSTTGARYNPTTDTWTPMSNVNAPIGCVGMRAVWTGSKMLIWGGQVNVYGSRLWTNTGAAYDPATDTWSAISTVGAPTAREQYAIAWTGSKMLVWGGGSGSNYLSTDTGGVYDPATNTWTAMSTVGAPLARSFGATDKGYAWTGTSLIVYGARNGDENGVYSPSAASGGIYDPVTNTWKKLAPPSSPFYTDEIHALPATGFAFSATAWMGTKFFSWGGWAAWGVTNTGGVYDPSNDKWIGTNLDGAPSGSIGASAIWTGSKVLVWGGGGAEFVSSSYTP